MLHWRPTCLIGYRHAPTETDMPHRRPTCLIGGQHAWSKSHRRPTCPIGDRDAPSETNMPNRRPTSLIENPSETDMPHRRQHAPSETDMPVKTHQRTKCLWIPIRDQYVCGDPSETNMPGKFNLNFTKYTGCLKKTLFRVLEPCLSFN